MNYLRVIILLIGFVFISTTINAQLTGLSGGLAFSTGVDYNTGTTGNPGLFGKVYIKVNKRFHLVPSIVAFNKYEKSDISNITLKTYMFQADLDGVFSLYKDKALRFVGFAGLNVTDLISRWEIHNTQINRDNFTNKTDLKPGLNLGIASQMYVNDSFDAYISAKYILSSFKQGVINVGVIYYLDGKRRKGAW